MRVVRPHVQDAFYMRALHHSQATAAPFCLNIADAKPLVSCMSPLCMHYLSIDASVPNQH